MDLNEIVVFVGVVQAGSIRGAASRLAMPKSTVSRKVSELEERLDARLLQRTTRKVSLTDIGRIYYDYCVRIVAEIENAEHAVRSQQKTPRGLLRVTAPINVAFLGPIVSSYLARYPEVRLELNCTARLVDLIEERFDLGIRTGKLADSTLIARDLGSVERFLVATPAYLKQRGRPKAPEDLKKHDCLLFGAGVQMALQNAQGVKEVTLPARLLATDIDVLYTVATASLGIAVLPAFLCAKDLKARRLERVLPGWAALPTPIHVVYPSSRHISPTVRSFVDHLQERMTPPPWGFSRPAS